MLLPRILCSYIIYYNMDTYIHVYSSNIIFINVFIFAMTIFLKGDKVCQIVDIQLVNHISILLRFELGNALKSYSLGIARRSISDKISFSP